MSRANPVRCCSCILSLPTQRKHTSLNRKGFGGNGGCLVKINIHYPGRQLVGLESPITVHQPHHTFQARIENHKCSMLQLELRSVVQNKSALREKKSGENLAFDFFFTIELKIIQKRLQLRIFQCIFLTSFLYGNRRGFA